MILSDRMIKRARLNGQILIEPFDESCLGTNSYDVHLGPTLLTYHGELDCKVEPQTWEHTIPDTGMTLLPGELYLGSTVEYTETLCHVPFLDGKSSIGRMGITVHCTAGRGDVGFRGHWTLEIHVVRPVTVYAGMKIGQIYYFECGEVSRYYEDKIDAKYKDGRDPRPQPSRMWKNFK